MSPQSTPPRRVAFDDNVTVSPVSEACDDPSSPNESFDSFDSIEAPYELPSLSQIDYELQRLVKKAVLSKANYRAKVGKMSDELADANHTVRMLEQQLDEAREKQAIAQNGIDKVRQRRSDESDRIVIRKMHIEIMNRALKLPEFLPDIYNIQEKQRRKKDKYERLSGHPLALIRHRLEEIRRMLEEAEDTTSEKARSASSSSRASLEEGAISMYILYQEFDEV